MPPIPPPASCSPPLGTQPGLGFHLGHALCLEHLGFLLPLGQCLLYCWHGNTSMGQSEFPTEFKREICVSSTAWCQHLWVDRWAGGRVCEWLNRGVAGWRDAGCTVWKVGSGWVCERWASSVGGM